MKLRLVNLLPRHGNFGKRSLIIASRMFWESNGGLEIR